MWLQACLNGRRTAVDHPATPVTPAQLAADAAACAEAGVQALHIHPRDSRGRESLRATDVAAAVRAIRRARPGLAVGVSTGSWVTGGSAQVRASLLREWSRLPADDRPHFASCNIGEAGWREAWDLLLAAGIGVEAGVWSLTDLEHLGADPRGSTALRVLLEVIDVPAARAVPTAVALLDRLPALLSAAPCLLHGEGPTAWPLLELAVRRGVATRIGLEDVLQDPAGEPIGGNADLVRIARGMAARSGGAEAGNGVRPR